jgi:hypothetical protein
MRTQKMTIDDLYELYGHLQGQLAAATNLAAAVAALHPDRQTIERVIESTAASKGYHREGGSSAAEQAYPAGMESAIAVFRGALAGMKPPSWVQAYRASITYTEMTASAIKSTAVVENVCPEFVRWLRQAA